MDCFQLFKKGESSAVSLNKIDEEICINVLNVDVDAKKYGGGFVKNGFDWFNTIGFQISQGKALGSQELKDHYLASEMWAEEAPIIEKVINYLENNYSSTSFYARK
jgi:hypothetical protein